MSLTSPLVVPRSCESFCACLTIRALCADNDRPFSVPPTSSPRFSSCSAADSFPSSALRAAYTATTSSSASGLCSEMYDSESMLRRYVSAVVLALDEARRRLGEGLSEGEPGSELRSSATSYGG